jgi:anti-sigma regulatory factor (Ser/Thr protein kinase)
MDKAFVSYRMEERSFVSYIKREIHSQILRSEFTRTKAAEIDIIVSEITSNVIKHAGSGELLYRIEDVDNGPTKFEIISIDNGPGIADTARMMRDGVSTTHTLGQGLGAINRLSDIAQLYSIPGWGTVLYAAVYRKAPDDEAQLGVDIRYFSVNKPRETVCGDGCRVRSTNTETMIFFGDGLGHGVHAKSAVDAAGEFFLSCNEREPVEIIRAMHERIRRTRGLVGTIAVLNRLTNEWTICGVGNVLTRMYTGINFKSYMPYNGTIGLNIPNSMSVTPFNAERNQHLIMCSDGIGTRWELNRYPFIFKYDSMILAAAIYKDYNRGHDDSSILIAKVS